jgi:hypothetical protein
MDGNSFLQQQSTSQGIFGYRDAKHRHLQI